MFIIYFEDGQVFHGGDLENSLWSKIPDKPIKKIDYTFLDETVSFEDYEEYNHIIEHTHLTYNNVDKINKIILMAKKRDIVYMYIFDLFDKKIYRETCEFGKEWYGKSVSGWKKGIIDKI